MALRARWRRRGGTRTRQEAAPCAGDTHSRPNVKHGRLESKTVGGTSSPSGHRRSRRTAAPANGIIRGGQCRREHYQDQAQSAEPPGSDTRLDGSHALTRGTPPRHTGGGDAGIRASAAVRFSRSIARRRLQALPAIVGGITWLYALFTDRQNMFRSTSRAPTGLAGCRHKLGQPW